MAKSPAEIQTKLSIQEIASVFQQSMRVSWFSEKITRAGTKFDTPRDTVFSSLNENPPQFSVEASLGGRGVEIQKSAVQMYVWDRGDYREITLVVEKNLGAFGVKAKQKIKKFVTEIEDLDPKSQCVGL